MPQTRWARTVDGADIAYQDFGEGPVTLVVIHGWVSHLEVYWEQPRYERFMRRLAAGMRVIVFDKRGVGMSDRLTESIDLETLADDIGAVMDAAHVDRAAVLAWGSFGPTLATYFAAAHPDRTAALCIDPYIQARRSPGWPFGDAPAAFEEEIQANIPHRNPDVVEGYDDPPDDPGFAAWDAKLTRYSSTPASYERYMRTMFDLDVMDILPAVRVPTLVLAKEGGWATPEMAAFVADRIPGAQAVTVPGREGVIWVEPPEPYVAAIERFLEVQGPPPDHDRVLATVLFTDIVGSTARSAELGDAAWTDVVASHHRVVRTLLEHYRGQEVDTAGDGFYATFDGPARAARCALAIVDGVRPFGIEIRAGVHTGECVLVDDKLGGLAVSIGARVAAKAGASEVMASSTVKDLVAGSGLVFEEAGEHELKGVPDRWRLYRVVG